MVDSHGVPSGLTLPREDALSLKLKGYYVPIAVTVVHNNFGEVLVQQRSVNKPADPGKLDLVCGIVSAGEHPTLTAIRESLEETGILPMNVRLIAQGVNIYDRYRYLFAGQTRYRGMSVELPNHEVEWAGMKNAMMLEGLVDSGDIEPVGDFFEHLALASLHHQALSKELPSLAYASPQEA